MKHRATPLLPMHSDIVHQPLARDDIHAIDCSCPACEPYVPGVARPLTPNQIALRMLGGVLAGNLIAFAIDPSGSWATLTGAVRQVFGL